MVRFIADSMSASRIVSVFRLHPSQSQILQFEASSTDKMQ